MRFSKAVVRFCQAPAGVFSTTFWNSRIGVSSTWTACRGDPGPPLLGLFLEYTDIVIDMDEGSLSKSCLRLSMLVDPCVYSQCLNDNTERGCCHSQDVSSLSKVRTG